MIRGPAVRGGPFLPRPARAPALPPPGGKGARWGHPPPGLGDRGVPAARQSAFASARRDGRPGCHRAVARRAGGRRRGPSSRDRPEGRPGVPGLPTTARPGSLPAGGGGGYNRRPQPQSAAGRAGTQAGRGRRGAGLRSRAERRRAVWLRHRRSRYSGRGGETGRGGEERAAA